MPTYVMRNGEFVLKSEAAPLGHGVRGVLSDSMDLTWHPADGKYYDSKHRFREATRAHGCVEVGNEKLPGRQTRERPRVAPYIARAIEQLTNR